MSSPRRRLQLRQARAAALLDVLGDRWPLAFPPDPAKVRPLKIGVFDDLAAALEGQAPRRILRAALREWTRRPAYLRACAAGKRRRALDGTRLAPVDTEGQAVARERLRGLLKPPGGREGGAPRLFRRPKNREAPGRA